MGLFQFYNVFYMQIHKRASCHRCGEARIRWNIKEKDVIRMPENRGYLPEGLSAPPLYTLEMLRRAVSDGTVLEGTVQRCDGDLNLYLQLGSTFAKIPREEVTAPVDQRCRPGDCRFIKGRKAGLFYGGIPLRRRERRADGPALPPEGPGTGYGGNAPRSEAGSRGGGKGGTHGALRGLRGHWPGHCGSAAHGVHLRRPHPPSQRAVPGGAENSGSGQGL